MTESDDTRRKRGRPPKSIPDRDWFEVQLEGARALAKWHEEKGNHAHARASHERVAELEKERPAKWRANRPIAAYESRHPVLPWSAFRFAAEARRQLPAHRLVFWGEVFGTVWRLDFAGARQEF